MLVFPSFLFRLQNLKQNLLCFLHQTTFSNICSMFQPLRGPTSLQRNKPFGDLSPRRIQTAAYRDGGGAGFSHVFSVRASRAEKKATSEQ